MNSREKYFENRDFWSEGTSAEISDTFSVFLDPCSDITCHYPQVCRLNFDRTASCVCSTKKCSNNFEPVCANNGNTYLNECFMDLEICYANRSLHVIHSNDCSTSMTSKMILRLY